MQRLQRRPPPRAERPPVQFSRAFILRPVATSLLMLAVLIAGLLAWRLLPVAALPQVDFQAEEEYFRRCIEINS